jgi:acyl dehydratase
MSVSASDGAAHGLGVGDVVAKRHLFTRDGVIAMATAFGDPNPLHHDEAAARKSRHGGLIACAAHSTGVLCSLLAEHYAGIGAPLGLEFEYKLKRAVPAGLEATLSWRVVAKHAAAKLGGDILALEGDITDDAGVVYVTASGRLLVTVAIA